MSFDKKYLIKMIGALVGMLVLMKVSGGYGYLVVIPFACVSFCARKYDMAMLVLVLTIALLMGNAFLMPKNNVMLLSQRIMFMTFGLFMITSLTSKVKSPCIAPLTYLYPYLFYMFIPSAVGWQMTISYLKIILFLIIYTCYLGLANEVAVSSKTNAQKMRSIILSVVIFYVIGSVCLIPFPSISQLSGQEYADAVARGNDVTSLFKGMTMHSQALGVFASTLASFVLADWVFSVRKFSKLYAILLALSIMLIYMSSSRTAMGSFLFAVVLATFLLMKERGFGAKWRSKVKSSIMLCFAICSLAVVAIPSTRDAVVRFALKYNASATVSDFDIEKAVSTRQGIAEQQLYNFRKSPVFGNGFQVSYDMQYKKHLSFANLLSAPVEKGVWVTAVLEEGGIFGFFFFSLFVIIASVKLLGARAYTALIMFLVMIVSNMGELTMFSLTSTGGFCWLFIAFSGILDALRQRDDKRMMTGQWNGGPGGMPMTGRWYGGPGGMPMMGPPPFRR